VRCVRTRTTRKTIKTKTADATDARKFVLNGSETKAKI
jgi:hypothetical protein